MPTATTVKSILNKTKRRDPWFLDDYTANPYSGCSFNCLFCYIRGSKYGLHMEEKLAIKTNAPELLDKQLALRARKGQYGIIVLSSATDPYLHFEEKEQLTRQLLTIILRHRFPVHIITRSPLVTRDVDLLHQINEQAILPPDLEGRLTQKAIVTFSFSTLDEATACIFEPGAPAPVLRLQALQQTLQAGLLSGVSLMPLLPYITDTGDNLHHLFSSFAAAGARYIFPASLTLMGQDATDNRQLVLRAVAKHYPHLLEKYDRFFAHATAMPGWYTQALHHKTQELCRQYGIADRIV
jgi:DNA repair photolyase